MTLAQAKKLLPTWARGLSPYDDDRDVTTVLELRAAVNFELCEWLSGRNPLEPKQVEALRGFLRKTEGAR